MENSNKEDKKKDQEWIQCTSKSRPGLKYMFNTATGESKWLTKDGGTKEAAADNEGPAKKFKFKTPAQDRLKRLQKEIVKAPKNQEKSSKLSRRANFVSPTKPNISKKSEEETIKKPSEDENTPSQVNKDLPTVKTRKRASSSSQRPKKLSQQLEEILAKTKVKQTTQFKIPKKKTITTTQKQEIKNICSSKPLETLICNLQKEYINKLDNGIEQKRVNEIRAQNVEKVTSPIEKKATQPLKRSNFIQKTGLANKRLEELRKSLQKALDSKVDDISEKLERQKYINNLKSPKQEDDIQNVEPMDWESDGNNIQEFAKVAEEKVTSRSYYNKNTINENLIHYGNGQRSPTDKQEKWQKDFYYFIPDTNVFLDHLTFLDELSTMKLHDTQGTMLYIPYIVIKELDGLKLRENVAARARRAINYIHDKLKKKCPHVQTQSAIDERDYIIEVDGPDDAIINCCLQVQRHAEKVLLLSEDTNLRNKAQCNDLLVSTKSDLVSYHVRPS